MTVSADNISEVRRMVEEPDDSNGYDDTLLTAIIGKYPLIDELGTVPHTWNTSTTPPTKTANTSWIATYDLHAAAGRVWEEKAAKQAKNYTFSADGGQYVRSEAYKQMMDQARYHNARRSANTIKLHASPSPLVPDDKLTN